jgi:hypothetical protein
MRKFVLVPVLALCLGLAACGGAGSAKTQISIPLPPGQASLEVLFPPTNPGEPDYNAVQTYLVNNAAVAGANFYLKWAVADQGPGASPRYDFSSIDSELQPWIGAGKKVNLVVWAVSDSSSNDATPQYVLNSLGAANTVTCVANGSSEIVPNYFDVPDFQTPYKAFMAAVVQHYSGNAALGYIRFGLARGGETFPALGFNSDPICAAAFLNNWGWTSATWTRYLTSLLDYEKSLDSPKQLMVGINEVNHDLSIPDAVASRAVQDGIGFGSQGFQLSDTVDYPACDVDWCNLFNQFAGRAPLELQTLTQSSPSGAPPTGSLVTLLPFAAQHHATILELYYADWLTGFDPNYPGYDPAYGTAIQAAAQASAP